MSFYFAYIFSDLKIKMKKMETFSLVVTSKIVESIFRDEREIREA